MKRAVPSISKARLADTLRLSATAGVAQNRPTLMPDTANRALSAGTARSQLATSWQPAAVAMPWTLAMTGTGKACRPCMTLPHLRNSARAPNSPSDKALNCEGRFMRSVTTPFSAVRSSRGCSAEVSSAMLSPGLEVEYGRQDTAKRTAWRIHAARRRAMPGDRHSSGTTITAPIKAMAACGAMPLSSSKVAMTAEPLIWNRPYTAAAVPARSAKGSSARLRPDPSASEKPTSGRRRAA
ncbi:hypothetical protein G6F22_016848 [Rhizopus arrhizus]|nr:hypothetical protein G6F22_016848 [Rhizopus arrhizus]